MSDERAAVSEIVLTAMGDAWSDSEEYSALPGVTADLLLTSDWLAEHDRQVAERAWDEAIQHQWKHRPIGNRSPHNPYRAAKGEPPKADATWPGVVNNWPLRGDEA